MAIKSARFVKSAAAWKDCPGDPLPEYAFLGRSNVGKSSLINMLTRHGKLAKISSSPGKTRLINHFIINEAWFLVDLMGYGYAKVPLPIKKKWEQLTRAYLLNRQNLACSFVLIDSRHAPQKNDIAFLQWMGEQGLPFCLVFTKADKLSVNGLKKNLEVYERTLSEQWNPLPQGFVSSSKTGEGREEILDFIDSCNRNDRP